MAQVVFLIWEVLVTALLIVLGCKLARAHEQIDALFTALFNVSRDIDDVRNFITEVENENKERISVLSDKYEQAEDMMNQVRSAAEEAAATERKMQDGITEIMNYSGIEAIRKTFR